jgi:hypothetical protein
MLSLQTSFVNIIINFGTLQRHLRTLEQPLECFVKFTVDTVVHKALHLKSKLNYLASEK